MPKACLIDRSKFVDDRGHFENVPIAIEFANDFKKVVSNGKRVYICDNFQKGTIRGFHYHKYEQKIFICLKGAVKFVLLPQNMMNSVIWNPEIFILSADMNKALYIPADYANAWQSLTDNTVLLGISDKTVKESKKDDIRIDPMIKPAYWEVKNR